jgi:hypothetical protein
MAFRYSPHIVTDGLVLYLDGANQRSLVSGSTVWNDLTKNNYSGSLINGPIYSNTYGGSVNFDGVDDYCQYNIAYPYAMTVSTFGSSNVSTWSNFAGLGSARRQNGYIIHNDSSTQNVTFYMFDQNASFIGIGGINSIDITKVNYYTISTNGNNVHKIYLNGVLRRTSTTSITRTTTPTVQPGVLGKDDNISRYNNLKIYNHTIYNRQLTDVEVLNNFNSLKNRFGL